MSGELKPLERFNRLIANRNRKVEKGIPLHLWKDGHELKGKKLPKLL